MKFLIISTLVLFSWAAQADTLEGIGSQIGCHSYSDLGSKGYSYSQPESQVTGDQITFKFKYDFYACQEVGKKLGFFYNFESRKGTALVVKSNHLSFWDTADYSAEYPSIATGTVQITLPLSQLFSKKQLSALSSTGKLDTYLYVANGQNYVESWGKYQTSAGYYVLNLEFSQNTQKEVSVEVLSFRAMK